MPAGSRARWVTALAGATFAGLVGLYVYMLVYTAWLCDDAHFTFRTIDNFIQGYGLTWNVAERVQAYTHPLWMFLLSGLYALTGDLYYTPIFVSFALSLAAVLVLALGIARSMPRAVLAMTILVFSKTFVDYSTSGLETPLSYLLVAWFLWIYPRTGDGLRVTGSGEEKTGHGERSNLLKLSLLACLLVLNRMDLLLLVAPALATCWWRQRSWRATGIVLLGFLPFVAWEIFSVIYYGFPFPNTAYAKLNTGLPAWDVVRQGLYYLLNAVREDFLMVAVIAAALVAAAMRRRTRDAAVAIGIGLYLLYTVKIGGDFMSGRFLALPLVAAVAILVRLPAARREPAAAWAGAVLLVCAVGLAGKNPPIFSLDQYTCGETLDRHGIADERGWYYTYTGLLRENIGVSRSLPVHIRAYMGVADRREGRCVKASGVTAGFYGYFVGPQAHIVDVHALADPLLSRLPTFWLKGWRPGHFLRFIPDGYLEGLWDDTNGLTDPNLHAWFDKMWLITRGPLFSAARWTAIAEMNLGLYDDLIDKSYYRHPPDRIRMDKLAAPKQAGTPLDAPGNVRMPAAGLIVHFFRVARPQALEISLDAGRNYHIVYPAKDGSTVEEIIAAQPAGAAPGLAVYQLAVPAEAAAKGLDRVYLYPETGGGRCVVGHVRLFEE